MFFFCVYLCFLFLDCVSKKHLRNCWAYDSHLCRNSKIMLTHPKCFQFMTFYHLLLKIVVILQFLVSFSIYTNYMKSGFNWRNMNVRLGRYKMKLHTQYVKSLHHTVISQLAKQLSFNDRCTLAKVRGLVLHSYLCLVSWACFEYFMIKHIISPLVWLIKKFSTTNDLRLF